MLSWKKSGTWKDTKQILEKGKYLQVQPAHTQYENKWG